MATTHTPRPGAEAFRTRLAIIVGGSLEHLTDAAILKAVREDSKTTSLAATRPYVAGGAARIHNAGALTGDQVMRLLAPAVCAVALVCAVGPGAATVSFDLAQRTELKRVDLSGAAGMEVITSISELKKGEQLPRHSHHGVESAYVLQGSMVQLPGKAPVLMETGTSVVNLRDVPHAGFTVVGDTPLRLLTVHVVDKGKPLYEWTN
jgi:quercetin dioxygenase-like cupin family protein